MITIETKENEHYYLVLGWSDKYMRNKADYKRDFDIYDDALKFIDEIESECSVLKFYEVTDGIFTSIDL